MILAHPMLNHPVEWEQAYIHTFVIENPIMYRSFLSELYDQQQGLSGRFVLSKNFSILDVGKHVEIISDVLKMETDSNKKIITAIVKELTEIAINEKNDEVMELYGKINSVISDVIFSSGHEIVFDDINDISQIFKMYNIRPDCENLTLGEKILQHMEMCEKYLGKKLFVFLNLHSFFSKEELEKLFQDIIYRKNYVFLVERHDYKASTLEKKRIIDIDLCEI